ALWALHVTQGLSDRDLIGLLSDPDEYVRAWAVQFLAEDHEVPERALERMARMAAEDPSQVVRLYLASAMQRIAPEERWETVQALAARAEDSEDHNLPLMVWYAAEPLATVDMDRALQVALNAELPDILPFTVRRVAAIGGDEAVKSLAGSVALAENRQQQAELVRGLNELMGTQDVAQQP